jgi:hypothetical protein
MLKIMKNNIIHLRSKTAAKTTNNATIPEPAFQYSDHQYRETNSNKKKQANFCSLKISSKTHQRHYSGQQAILRTHNRKWSTLASNK